MYGRGIEPHIREVEAFQDVERLDHRRPLAPEARLIDGVAVERSGDRRLRLQAERGHIFVAQQPAVLTGERVDAVGDIAPIEVIAHCVDRLGAACPGGQRLLLDLRHRAQGASQVRLMEDVADLRNVPVRQVDAPRSGPLLQIPHAARQRHRAHFVDGKAVGQLDRGFHRFAERLGAEFPQRHQSRVHHARHQRRKNSRHRHPILQAALFGRIQDLVRLQLVMTEEVGRRQFGHGADPGDRPHLALLRANQDGRLAAEPEVREFAHGCGQHRRDPGIHGVAAAEIHPHAGLGGVFASRRHRAARAPRWNA